MTILHVSAVKGWGGGENHIENLCYELRDSNPEVTNIILCVKNNLFHSRLSKTDLKFETAPLSFNLDIRFSFKIIALCKKYKVDVIHIHDPTAIVLTIIANKFSELPNFIFSKKTSFPIRTNKSTLFKYNYPKIKKYLCVSNESKRVLAEAIIDKDKLLTVYHGTNISKKSTETPFKLREKFNIEPSKKIIGNIGNHIPAKSLETFIEVANDIINVQKRTDFHFIQIGNFSKITGRFTELIKQYNLESHIELLGYTANASNFIPQFDVFLMTSESEGIPQAIFESFYHKKPVVSTNVGGIPEIIQDNVNGFLTPKYDFKLLSEKVVFLFDNTGVIENFTTISHESLMKNYTADIMAQKTLTQYKLASNGY